MEPIVSPWLVWLVAIADGIRSFVCAVAIFSGVILGGLLLFAPAIAEDNPTGEVPKTLKRAMIVMISISLLSGTLYVLTPTTKQAAVIVASSMITRDAAIETKKTVKAIYNDMLSLIREQLSDEEDKR